MNDSSEIINENGGMRKASNLSNSSGSRFEEMIYLEIFAIFDGLFVYVIQRGAKFDNTK